MYFVSWYALYIGCMYSFLAVGSEDCDISIVKIHPQSHVPIQVVRTLQGHVSSVRALSCSSSSCDSRKRLLFSGGARASLKAWSIVAEGKLTLWSNFVRVLNVCQPLQQMR